MTRYPVCLCVYSACLTHYNEDNGQFFCFCFFCFLILSTCVGFFYLLKVKTLNSDMDSLIVQLNTKKKKKLNPLQRDL